MDPSAYQRRQRLVDQSNWTQPMVDSPGCFYSCSSLHHPHLHGPANNCCHHQPQRAQTAGEKKSLEKKNYYYFFFLNLDHAAATYISLCPAEEWSLVIPIRLSLWYTEGLWVPSGPSDGRSDAGSVLHYGLALVRSSHGPIHLSRQQP